jgi:hypothetical protein
VRRGELGLFGGFPDRNCGKGGLIDNLGFHALAKQGFTQTHRMIRLQSS